MQPSLTEENYSRWYQASQYLNLFRSQYHQSPGVQTALTIVGYGRLFVGLVLLQPVGRGGVAVGDD